MSHGQLDVREAFSITAAERLGITPLVPRAFRKGFLMAFLYPIGWK